MSKTKGRRGLHHRLMRIHTSCLSHSGLLVILIFALVFWGGFSPDDSATAGTLSGSLKMYLHGQRENAD